MIHLKKAQTSVVISASVSFALMLFKLVIGLVTGSVALLSDALDSLTDFLSMVGSFVGIKISRKKPSNDFNYGYGKAESITSFLISLLIIFAAVNLGKMGYDSFFENKIIENELIAYVAMIVSIITSVGLSFYLYKKGAELHNELLIITSKERFSDILRGLVVIASIYLNQAGFPYAQGIISVIICFTVFFIGVKSLALSIRGLMDGSPDKKITSRILAIIKDEKDISSFKNLRLKKSGSYVLGDVEIIVDKSYSIKQAHDIADHVEKNIKEEFNEIASFIIHVEPNE